MLFFRPEERVREWRAAHDYPMRPLVTMDARDDLVFDALTSELAASASYDARGR